MAFRIDPLSSRWLAAARQRLAGRVRRLPGGAARQRLTGGARRLAHGARLARRGVGPAVRVARRTARHRRVASAGRLVGVFAVALVGVVLGVLLGGRVEAELGPFHAQFAITPSLTGGTEVRIPPLGALHLRSHDGPAHFVVRLDALDQKRTKALVTDPKGLDRASVTAAADVQTGARRLALQVTGVAVLGAMALGAMVYRSARRTAACGGLALAIVAGTALVTVGTFRSNSIEEPSYEGLLVNAPAVVGDARRIAGRYEEYRAELQRLVQNVGRLYGAISTLPVYEPDTGTTRVLHISDMHLNPAAWTVVQTVAQQFNVDFVIDTGDITDWGSEPEASYVGAISELKVPYVFIRGNHDSAVTAAAVARQPNAKVLENQVVTVDGLTIAGIGDPRFTPDKSTESGVSPPPAGPAHQEFDSPVEGSGKQLAATIAAYGKPVDIALVHDPASARPLAGTCPLVLAGHLHKREIRHLDPPVTVPGAPKGPGTLEMIEGSTGGAGLRGLEASEPLPLALSVLYFDKAHVLQAYDDIQVGGTGQTEVLLQRHVVKPAPDATPSASETPEPTPEPGATPEPTPSGSPSATPTG